MRRFLLISWLAATCGRAAEQNVDCREPRVFPDVAVNAVILPYEYVGSQGDLERSEAAQRLGLVLQRDILLALLRYSSIAAVQMIKPAGPANCDPDRIADQLLGRQSGAATTIRRGNAAVLLWGVLYEEGNSLYVRSFLRMVRNVPAGDEVTMQAGNFKFAGEMPFRAIASPPVRVTESDLREIERVFRESSVVRIAPEESAPKNEIPFDPHFRFAYTVVEAKGEWIRIRPLQSGPSGWMHAAALIGQSPLSAKMPEVNLLVSSVGYLQALIANDATPKQNVVHNVDLSREALAAYERGAALDQTPEAAAAVRMLSARLRILRGGGASGWRQAVAELDKASALNPSNPGLSNFRTMCRAWLVWNRAADYSAAAIALDFRDAAVRSSDRRALDNLAAWYRAMLAEPRLRQQTNPPTDAATLRAELAKVEQIRATIK